MKATCVLLEGHYLSLISKHFGDGEPLRDWDIKQFGITLAKKEKLWCRDVYYYTAPPYQSPSPSTDEIRRKAGYDKFISKLKKIGIIVREGRCQKLKEETDEDFHFHQKGVDSYIHMDLLDILKKKNIDVVIIVTSDTDFVPILNKIREDDIKVILYYFSDFKRNSKFTMSNHLHTACDEKRLIKKEHFLLSMKENKNHLEEIRSE